MPDDLVAKISYSYDPKSRRFSNTGGREVSRETVRGEIDKLTDYVKREAGRIADRYSKGSINLAQFELDMRELLKSGHIIAASVGRGGRMRMTQADWGRVGSKIKWQYEYLAKFVRKIEQGKIDKILTANRAQKYASALHVTFYKAFATEASDAAEPADKRPLVRRILNAKESCPGCLEYAAMGWISVDEMPEIGDLDCGDFCKCDLEFEDD